MKLLVAITDSDWFNHLSELRPDEVNFWQPSGSGSFHSLSPGEPLLFKLHAPNNFIVGGGFFSHHTILPASFAWSAFGQKNGAATESEMRERIEKYRKVEPGSASDYSIGCILLQSPFFFPREEWFRFQAGTLRFNAIKGMLRMRKQGSGAGLKCSYVCNRGPFRYQRPRQSTEPALVSR